MDKIGTVSEDPRLSYIFEWSIEDFIFESALRVFPWNSPTFNFLDELWYLSATVDYYDDDKWLTLYLRRKDPVYERNIGLLCTLGLKEADGTVHKYKGVTHRFSLSERGPVCLRVAKTKKIIRQRKKLCPDGIITLYCKLFFDKECRREAQAQTHVHDDTLAQNLSDLYLKQKYCDITIDVGGRKFQAHRSILAARSAVFAGMFEYNTEVKKSGVVKLDDCDPDIFHDFLLYFYGGRVDISPKNAIALYCIADKYHFSQLTSSCVQVLLANLSVELFCDVLVLTMMSRNPMLIEAVEDFFAVHTQDILFSTNWQHFVKKNNIAGNELKEYAQTSKGRHKTLSLFQDLLKHFK